MRFEIKTSKGFLVFEDMNDKELTVYFVEGKDPAIAIQKKKFQVLGIVDKKSLIRLGKGM